MPAADRAAEVAGVVLAGGRGRRMGGGSKCLRPLGGRPLIAPVIERARPQVAALMINANAETEADRAAFARFGLPVAADVVGGFAGPLAGILTAMLWAREHCPACSWVASFAGDTPFFPTDLVAGLYAGVVRGEADIACATSDGRSQPVFALWSVRLADALHQALVDEDIRKIDAWTARFRVAQVPFPTEHGDPFFNINTVADLAIAEARLAGPRSLRA